MIHIKTAGDNAASDCVMVTFSLEKIFGEKFFPPANSKNQRELEDLRVSRASVKSEEVTFEIYKLDGIKKILIGGHTTKYHLELGLQRLDTLGLEIYIVMDLLSIMDVPEPQSYFLELKSKFNLNLCLSGDFIPVILARAQKRRELNPTKMRA